MNFKKRPAPFKKTAKSNTLLDVHPKTQRERYFLMDSMNFLNERSV
jgi:hypothetical protein